MNYIELFAGCGGLSLGLEKSGFDLILANELSPMAAETFAYNILGEDLSNIANNGREAERTYWLSSQYKNMSERLRENPTLYPEIGDGVTDVPVNPDQLYGKLLVANIIQLNQFLRGNDEFLKRIQCGFGKGEVDLISGGPPCQSFSLAGLRQKDCKKNTLPWEFANFVELVQPKFVILENVTGILRPFTQDGKNFYPWSEVSDVFSSKNYVPLCLHVNAKLTGVPQNRPRFIMLAIRHDIYLKISNNFNDVEKELFDPVYDYFCNSKENDNKYYDVSKRIELRFFKETFLSPLVDKNIINVKDAIDDLRINKKSVSKKSDFVVELNKEFELKLGKAKKILNHEPRANSEKVKRRFRVYQILRDCSNTTIKEVVGILKQEGCELSESAWGELMLKNFYKQTEEYGKFQKVGALVDFLKLHPTKKQTQKALDPTSPAPAALSIPDDACHYHVKELRTLTVREMARIQSFPDSFVFRSKVTTGGKMRRFEVPQYTQVGNAIPPLLGTALAKIIQSLNDKL